jgi:hypothetical protein
MKYEHNIETGKTSSKELNAEELTQWQNAVDTTAASQIAMEDRAKQKAALLVKLGITADEAKLLLS